MINYLQKASRLCDHIDDRDVKILAPTRSALEVEASQKEDQEVHSGIIVSFLQALPTITLNFYSNLFSV